MADESIRIPIEIDTSKGLAQLAGFGKSATSTIARFAPGGKVNIPFVFDSKAALASMQQLAAGSNNLSNSVVNASGRLAQLPRSSNEATFALTNMGRVVQDLPYGFVGIANNLNPLLESFQRLKVSTGSTTGALKAMGASFIGAGGLGFGLSIVSTGILLLTQGFQSFSRHTSKAKEDADAANESIKNLAKGFSDELVKLTSLVGLIQNVNTKRADQVNGLKALNEQYGPLLKNLGIEEVNLNNIATAYDRIIDSLLKQAVVKGLQEQITKEVEKSAKALITLEVGEEKRRLASEKSYTTSGKQISAFDAAAQGLAKFNKVQTDGYLGQIKASQSADAAVSTYTTYEAQIARIKNKLMQTLQPLLNLTKNFSDLNLELDKSGKQKIEKEFIPNFDKIRIPVGVELQFDIDKFRQVLLDTVPLTFAQTFQKKLQDDLTELGKNLGPENNPIIINAKLKPAIAEDTRLQVQKLIDDLNVIFAQGIASISTSIGEGIGDAISGKTDAFRSILTTMGGFIAQIGQALIKYGIIKEGLDKILGPGGIVIPGAVAIGLGIFAVAAGQLLKNVKGGATGFASGGLVFGPTMGLVGEGRGTNRSNPEVISPLDKLKSFFGDMLNDFVGRASNVGGNINTGGLQFAVQTQPLRFDGRDLVSAVTLVQQRNERGG